MDRTCSAILSDLLPQIRELAQTTTSREGQAHFLAALEHLTKASTLDLDTPPCSCAVCAGDPDALRAGDHSTAIESVCDCAFHDARLGVIKAGGRLLDGELAAQLIADATERRAEIDALNAPTPGAEHGRDAHVATVREMMVSASLRAMTAVHS